MPSELTTTPTSREMAVEAANRIRELHKDLCDELMLDNEPTHWVKTTKPDAILARYILQSPPPDDSVYRDFDAEAFLNEVAKDAIRWRDGEDLGCSLNEFIHRKAAELSRLAGRPQGWRPIDEAPKDSRIVIGWYDDGIFEQAIGCFDPHRGIWIDDGFISHEPTLWRHMYGIPSPDAA